MVSILPLSSIYWDDELPDNFAALPDNDYAGWFAHLQSGCNCGTTSRFRTTTLSFGRTCAPQLRTGRSFAVLSFPMKTEWSEKEWSGIVRKPLKRFLQMPMNLPSAKCALGYKASPQPFGSIKSNPTKIRNQRGGRDGQRGCDDSFIGNNRAAMLELPSHLSTLKAPIY